MNKKNINFGIEKEIQEVCEKLSNINYEGGNIALSDKATLTERIKYEFCQGISQYKRKNNLSLVNIANLLDLNENITDKLLRGHIENFSLDSLISYGERLSLPIRVEIANQIC